MANGTHTLEVWGDFACFTRPEMKVERFSYPVITPSAARGIFDAIYWDGLRERQGRESIMRPYFHWQLIRIEVLELPRYIALRRNEVKDKVPADRTLKAWMEGREQPEPIWADGGKDELGTDQKGRTQRQTMALKNVRYRLTAKIVPKPENSPRSLSMWNRQMPKASHALPWISIWVLCSTTCLTCERTRLRIPTNRSSLCLMPTSATAYWKFRRSTARW